MWKLFSAYFANLPAKVLDMRQLPQPTIFFASVHSVHTQFAFFDFGVGKLILKYILAHLRVGEFCKFYEITATDGIITGLWRGCGWKRSKWRGEDLPRALQRMQAGCIPGYATGF